MSAWHRSYEIKEAWATLLRFWHWPLLWPRILLGKLWYMDLSCSSCSFYTHNSREYIGLTCHTHPGTYQKYYWSILITFHCRSHSSQPVWHTQQWRQWWLWCCYGWYKLFQLSVLSIELVCVWKLRCLVRGVSGGGSGGGLVGKYISSGRLE